METADAFQAVENGNAARIREMLIIDRTLANAENKDGLTLLGVAAHYGHKAVVQTLLDYGADINALSHSKLSFIPSNTALHAAIAGNAPEVVKLLIEKGADVNAVDSIGHTPIQAAAFEGRMEIARLLINKGADLSNKSGSGSAVSIATKRGHHQFAELLRQRGSTE